MDNLPALFNLAGRVAIVSGGAGLLGQEFCKTLAQAGASVVVADKNATETQMVVSNLVSQGFRASGIVVDITDKYSVANMVSKTLESFGGVDILVNSAALDPKFDPDSRQQTSVGISGAFEDYPLEAWQEALNVNLTGMFLSCQAVGRVMREQKQGVIVNISSIYGVVGPDQRIYRQDGLQQQYKPVYYSVTKAGVLGLTRYLAAYYAGTGIRVNALTPGGVFAGHDDEFLKAYSSRTILGRMAERNEMNGALLFLASDASSYMTGANLIVDGGWTAW